MAGDAGNQPAKSLDRVLAAGRSLWLAGVGAVAEVSEGGVEMFDRLVERGRPLEEKQKKLVAAVTERAGKISREAGQLVQDTVEFESRGLLKKMNVMTRDDVKVLNARISTLTSKVDEVVARRFTPAKSAKTVEIVDPSGDTAAVVIPVTSAATRAKAARPAQKKATR
ncbi:MAG TPA: phasin family protein [Solirubrobacterales bacterium]|nr:phasin family protein [Solirubrobacterales bacterium]